MKLAVWILLLALPVLGQETRETHYIGGFGGIDQFRDSSKINDFDAIDAENVLTDRGDLEKRPGNVLLEQLLSGGTIEFHTEFISQANIRFLVFQESGTIYASDTNLPPFVVSTVTPGFPIDAATAFGKIFFVNGIDPGFSWDGSSTEPVNNMPVARFIEFADERLYLANITNDSSSKVRVSSFGFADGWDIPFDVFENATAPNSFTFQQNDGEQILGLKETPWGKVVWKRSSMFILKGFDNLTYYKRSVDPEKGIIDDRTVDFLDGSLVWAGLDGIYSWRGAGEPQLISRDVEPIHRAFKQRDSKLDQAIWSSQADWERGESTSDGLSELWSTTINPGAIAYSTWGVVVTDSETFTPFLVRNVSTNSPGILYAFRPGDGSFLNAGAEVDTLTHWTFTGPNAVNVLQGPPACGFYQSRCWNQNFPLDACGDELDIDILDQEGVVLIDDGISITDNLAYTQRIISTANLATGTIKIRFTMSDQGGAANTVAESASFLRPDTITLAARDSNPAVGTCTASWDIDETNTGNISGNFTISTNTGFFNPRFGRFQADQTTPGPANTIDWTAIYRDCSTCTPTGQFTQNLNERAVNQLNWRNHITFTAVFTASAVVVTPGVLREASLAAIGLGVYTSDVRFVGDDVTNFLTGDFLVTSPDAMDPLVFTIRSATEIFTINSATPAYVAHNNNTVSNISSGTHIQFRVDSTGIDPLDGFSQLIFDEISTFTFVTKFTQNWQEGVAAPMAAGIDDHRYFLCGAINSDSNDTCLVYQKNRDWVKFTGPSYGSMARFDGELVVGDGAGSGKLWNTMVEGVFQDDGDPINAFWISKDFLLKAPDRDKTLYRIWIDANAEPGANVNVGFATNKTSTFTLISVDLAVAPVLINVETGVVDGRERARTFRFFFGNGDLDEFFRLNAYTAYYDIEDRRQE